MGKNLSTGLLIAFAGLLAGCSDDGRTYTLYRGSAVDQNMRIHVASFDAKEDEAYNRENCEQAVQLYMAQPGVKVRFWCEKGRYRS